MDSPAFFNKLVTARPIIDASASIQIASLGKSNVNFTSGCPLSCNNIVPLRNSLKFVGRQSGSGIRANCENSSTIRLSSLVWRTMTSVIRSSCSDSSPTCGENLRLMRSADNRIGVKGFLISWAIRRATSPQAAIRCALTKSVTSSRAIT